MVIKRALFFCFANSSKVTPPTPSTQRPPTTRATFGDMEEGEEEGTLESAGDDMVDGDGDVDSN